MISEIFAYLGGFFVIAGFIPQIIQSYRTKRVADLSLLMVLAAFLGGIFYTIYGILIKSTAIISVNIIFIFLVITQLFLKIRYNKK